jgi:hypothetical protein
MYKTLAIILALLTAMPLPAAAQCYQGCSGLIGFFAGLITGQILAQPTTVVVTQPQIVYQQPSWGMATSNGCIQQLVGYDQYNRPVMQYICR